MKTHALSTAIEWFKSSLTGTLLLPEQKGFQETIALWNASLKQQPLLVVLPENTQDVVKAVRFAQAHALPLSVRGGGHDWAGRALTAGSVHLNLRHLNSVQVDVGQRTATVQGGATSMDVVLATEPHQLVPVTGTVGQVGFAGLLLGGGYGLLSASYGLACDNLLSAEVVLADGRVCAASAQENPELFWALRGGGGGFGIVTALQVQLYEAPPLLAGLLVFNGADATQVLGGYHELMAHASKQLEVGVGMIAGLGGQLAVVMAAYWFGDPTEGMRQLEVLKGLGRLIQARIGPTTYREIMEDGNARLGAAHSYSVQTRSLPTLEAEQIQPIIAAMQTATSPLSTVAIRFIFGDATTVAATETAFYLRKPHYMLQIVAAWDEPGTSYGEQHAQWASQLSRALQPAAYPGGYANLLGPDETEQNKLAFGKNLARLQQIKRTYDPKILFKGLSFPLTA